jgi:hypothetical protein
MTNSHNKILGRYFRILSTLLLLYALSLGAMMPGAEVQRVRPEAIHPSAWKRNSRKFAVASDPSRSARSTSHRHDASPAASKNGDYVAFVAPLCSKPLRLVAARLPEKSSPIGPELCPTSRLG